MAEFKLDGEIFNLPTLETSVVSARDLLENRMTLIRTQVLSVISDPSNENYIFDPALHAALTDETVILDHIFKAYVVEPDYSLRLVNIPDFVQDTASTITISSTVTLEIPIDTATIDYTEVVTTTSNSINNTVLADLSDEEIAMLEDSYQEAYILAIAADTGINRSVLDNSDIVIELVNDGSGGIQVNVDVTSVDGANRELLEQIQQSITDVNSDGTLATNITAEVNRLSIERDITISFDLTGIPQTSDIFIALSKIDINGFSNALSSMDSLLNKRVEDMSVTEKFVVKEAYANVYIEKAALQGVVLNRDNVVITLVSGSIKVIIRVVNISLSDTTFGSQVESFLDTTATAGSPITSQDISTASLNVLTSILNGAYPGVSPEITDAVTNPNSDEYNQLNSFFASSTFINALDTSTVENVTLIISAEGDVESFIIQTLSDSAVNKKFMINRDSSIHTYNKKLDAIKKGKLNKSNGNFEKLSIAVQVRRQALRRVRSSGSRGISTKYAKCC